MAQMRPSLMPTSAFTTPSTASMIVTLVITRSGAPPARVTWLSMPMPSRMLLPPPKTISSPYAPRRSRSISTNSLVSPKRMRSPVVGPNRPTYSCREIDAMRILLFRRRMANVVRPRRRRFSASVRRTESALRRQRHRLGLGRAASVPAVGPSTRLLNP